MARKANVGSELEKIVLLIGEFMHYWGFKKIHGQIWSHIFLSQDPLDAHALMDRLDVSKALISISIKDLLFYDVIKEFGKSEKGTILYEANPNVVDVIIGVLKKREKKMLQDTELACKELRDVSLDEKKKMNLNPKKIRMLSKMIREAQNTLSTIIVLGELNLTTWKNIDDTET